MLMLMLIHFLLPFQYQQAQKKCINLFIDRNDVQRSNVDYKLNWLSR